MERGTKERNRGGCNPDEQDSGKATTGIAICMACNKKTALHGSHAINEGTTGTRNSHK